MEVKFEGRSATVFGKARISNEIGQQVCAASVFGQMGSPGVAGLLHVPPFFSHAYRRRMNEWKELV